MAVTMWRMNGLWRGMAGVLVLGALLLNNEVMCQETEVPTAAPPEPPSAGSDAAPSDPNAADPAPTAADSGKTAPAFITTVLPSTVKPPNKDGDRYLMENVASTDGENVKAEGRDSTQSQVPSSASSSVFVGILVSGLLLALALTIGYFKCQRKTDTKGVKLTEEAYPLDQDNQGNTLVSVAPLNPPPETQEKPSVNGESPEADKTQPPPPTNGHSTAKTADTEM